MLDEPNRRRHARWPAAVAIELRGDAGDAGAVAVARVIDVSLGGALVELAAEREPPALGWRCRARVRRGDAVVERAARVVRVRWGGREKGAPVPPAVALVFDDADADAALRLEEMLA